MQRVGSRQLSRFDAEYYRRFYENPATRIISRDEQINEVAFVIAFCNHIGLEIRRVADVGAGTGWWAREFERQYGGGPDIETYDASQSACDVYGHQHVPLQLLGGKAADLVVCRDVLRYLADHDAEEGIRRLARKCRGVLYLHVATRDDDFDRDASDVEGYFRPRSWYRRRFDSAGFRDCGMGLLVSKRLAAFDPWEIDVR